MGMGIGTALGGHMTFGSPTAMGGVINTQNVPDQTQASTDAWAEKIRLLKELGELKNAGILTEEEFAEQKRKILQ